MTKPFTLFGVCYGSGALTAWAAFHSALGRPWVIEFVLACILGVSGIVICVTAVSEEQSR